MPTNTSDTVEELHDDLADEIAADDIADEDLEPVADETADSVRHVVAAHSVDADECRTLFSMLGINPNEKS